MYELRMNYKDTNDYTIINTKDDYNTLLQELRQYENNDNEIIKDGLGELNHYYTINESEY